MFLLRKSLLVVLVFLLGTVAYAEPCRYVAGKVKKVEGSTTTVQEVKTTVQIDREKISPALDKKLGHGIGKFQTYLVPLIALK